MLTPTTEIIRQKGPIGIGSATASVRGEVVCTAELTFAIGSKGGVEEKWRLCFRSGKKNRQKNTGGGSTGAAGDDCVLGLRQGDQ